MRRLLGLVVLLAIVPLAASASPGSLDPAFDGDGIATLPITTMRGLASSIDHDPSGNLIVAIQNMSGGDINCTLSRFQTDGSLDSGFGFAGLLNIPLHPTNRLEWCTARSQTSGGASKIVVLRTGASTNQLLRFHANGSPDSSFGTSSMATLSIRASDFAITASGDILVVGTTSGGEPALARFSADGHPDTSFGSSGTGLVSPSFFGTSPYEESFERVVEDASGKIVVAGRVANASEDFHLILARFNADGSLDSSFANGIKDTAPFETARSYMDVDALSLQTVSGVSKILVGSFYYCGTDTDEQDCAYIARFNADGNIDPTFGSGGMVIPPSNHTRGMAVQNNGKIVFVGRTGEIPSHSTIARYDADGTLNTYFGSSGTVVVMDGSGAGVELMADVAVDSSGRIVVVGASLPSPGTWTVTLARYIGDPILPTITIPGGFRESILPSPARPAIKSGWLRFRQKAFFEPAKVPLGSPCGNGVVDKGEECDDNNANNGDGCSDHCTLEPRRKN